jgi:D-sedoheptulose 7-phosphate isomerase
MITKYYDELNQFVKKIEVADREGKNIPLADAANKVIDIILERNAKGKKVIFIGNGGSAAVASHMAIDFWKNGKIKATAFTDASLITCLSNDYGYEHVYAKPIEMFADDGDVLIAISSSGKSKNILNAVETAKNKGCSVVTLSGFSADNPLAKIGDINFYVPADAYSHVEIIHHTICHYILEMIIERGLPRAESRGEKNA